MPHAIFHPRGDGFTVAELASRIGADVHASGRAELKITGLASLREAQESDIAVFDNLRYEADLAGTQAGCVLLGRRYKDRPTPEGVAVLVADNAGSAFNLAGRELFPAALLPSAISGRPGISPQAHVDSTAKLEEGVTIEPFVVIGPDVEIGRGTVIGAGAAIGANCRIGRDCRIGASVTLTHCLVGNRVIIHPGVKAGQDGFGYVPGPAGLVKSVQVGRVVIQDDVEVGANTTIDRGAVRDTIIGEGTKIDNQVQIGHNVTIGRHCVIVSQVGISGSVDIGDGVLIGGQVGVSGHVKIGSAAQIAATASVAGDVPAGARWGGTPARPIRDWFREITVLAELAKKRRTPGKTDD